ncbi:MAG: hypothetical protein ACRYFB_07780 [Janthinobacterium lividum]
MRIFHYIFILLIISPKLDAQQVKKIDCCYNVTSKATIIINNNTLNANSDTAASTINGIFNFELTSSVNTSAGVYNADGNLVRTLWSGVKYDAGCYVGQWDGYLDDGITIAPYGTYTVKALFNNVQYDWLGVIGNSSDSHINNQINPGNGFFGIACTANNLYLAEGYAERDEKHQKIPLSDLGAAYNVLEGSQTMAVNCVAKNSTMVFWGGADPYSGSVHDYPAPNFLFATNISDDSEVIFPAGTTKARIGIDGRLYNSVFGVSNNNIDCIALNDSYIFVGRSDSTIEVYSITNKISLIKKNKLSFRAASIALYQNYLWISLNNQVTQYVTSSDGSVIITGMSLPVQSDAIAISNGGELAVTDRSSHQIKFYNASTGAPSGVVLGSAGGNATNPAVTDYRFLFHNKRGDNSPVTRNAAITYQPDGSFWVFDPGNYRLMHYNTGRTFIEKISYVPFCRSVNIDPNNPASMFADALEYQVDFSKVTTDINHSWELRYNWFSTTDLDTYGQFDQVVTLNNNHQYGIGGGKLYDLLPTGAILFTGINLNNQVLEQDGSLWARDFDNSGLSVIRKANLTGFTSNADGSQTPVWGTYTTIVTTPAFATNPGQPVFYINNTFGASTNPNRYFFFDQFYGPVFNGVTTGKGYHLGSIKTGDNKWEWLASKSLPESYGGEFSRNGWFDYSGQSNQCRADINGANIFWHVNCELGRFTETTYTNHFNEDGLFIGQFGTDNVRVSYTQNTSYWAGNSFKTQLAKVGSDLYYVYCDESKHAGIHLIKVSNLSSVKEMSLPLSVSAPVTPIVDTANLLNALPVNATNFTGNSIWSVITQPTNFSTGNYAYEKGDNSVSIGTSNYSKVRCKLADGNKDTYTLSGQLSFDNSQPTFHDGSANYLDFTDQAGKVIARFEEHAADAYARSLRVNGVTITGSDGGYSYGELKLFTSFSYTYANGIFTFQIGKYAPVVVSSPLEAGADMTRPGYLVINQQGDYGNQYHQFNLKGLRFTAQ